MKVSVVVPTYNRVDKLKQCLNSILSQDYKHNYDVIVIDDGSTDGTKNYLFELLKQNHNLKVITLSNQGPAVARNKGIQSSNGDIIFFTDDDCIVPYNWISSIMSVFEGYSDIVAVGGYLEAAPDVLKNNVFARFESYQSEKLYGAHHNRNLYLTIGGFDVPAVVTNNCAYRKAILNEFGGFDELFKCPAGEDADLKYRVTQKYKIAYVPLRVIHNQNYGLKRFISQKKGLVSGDKTFKHKWNHKYIQQPNNILFYMVYDTKFELIPIYIMARAIGLIYKSKNIWM